MKGLPVLAFVCMAAMAAGGCKKTGSAGADEPQQAGLLREVEEQAVEDLECQGGGGDDDENDDEDQLDEEGDDGGEDGDDDEDDDDDDGGEDGDDDEGDDGDDGGITVRWVDGGYLAEGCGRQVRYEVDCVGDPGEEVCSISLDDGRDDEARADGDDDDDGDEDEDAEEAREAREEDDEAHDDDED